MTASRLMLAACTAMALMGSAPAGSTVGAYHHGATAQAGPGFIVDADARFDPFIQRLIAERSLKVLPLKNGQLFYVVPVNVDPRLEEMQIRYLEWLLDKAGEHEGFEPSAGER